MADKKISELTAASSVGSSDITVLVQGGNTLSLSIGTLLANLPKRPVVLEAQETIASGAISTALLYTELSNAAAGVAYTLAAGTHGMEKVIVNTGSTSSGTNSITVTGGRNIATVTFATGATGVGQ